MNDENILQKLAEMSMNISEDNNLRNLNYKTGAISNNNAIQNNRISSNASIEKELLNKEEHLLLNSNLKKSFGLIENEILNNNIKNNSKIEDEITKDLNAYLKSHNIKDGNLIETRRIDLRPSQNSNIEKSKTLSKNDLFNKNCKNGVAKLKFLNDCSSTSSSDTSDTDEENNKALWIERYRKQKQIQMEANLKKS